MKRFIFLLLILPRCAFCAADVNIEEVLRNTYTACIGIEDRLQDLKKMAGINTAVTAVGTGTGIGATAVGIVKSGVDEEIQEVKVRLKNLRKISEEKDHTNTREDIDNYKKSIENYSEDKINTIDDRYKKIEEENEKLSELTKKSKKLGHWRTGLLATSTATGVAGAVIASNNKIDDDLDVQIKNCANSVDILRKVAAATRVSGGDVFDSKEIISACEGYKYIDITSINNKAKNAKISSIVTAATGATGTILSAVANTDSVREEGGQKEKNLNLSSNIMSAGTAISGGVATVFNATQISLIKKTADIARACSEALR